MSENTQELSSNRNAILEQGHIYFFYRPRVVSAEESEDVTVQSMADIQRFYFVLHPENSKKYRLILVGEKKLPSIESSHEKDWAMVDFVTNDKKDLINALNEQNYETKTRGSRVLPAMRPAGEGVYRIVAQERNTYLAYILELPAKTGEVQHTLEIEPQASYVLSVKNPYVTENRSTRAPGYPNDVKEKFTKLRFIPADPPKILNYAGTELLLIGARTNIQEELGIKIDKQHENIQSASIFTDLKLWKEEHPVSPLLEGKWE